MGLRKPDVVEDQWNVAFGASQDDECANSPDGRFLDIAHGDLPCFGNNTYPNPLVKHTRRSQVERGNALRVQ